MMKDFLYTFYDERYFQYFTKNSLPNNVQHSLRLKKSNEIEK